MQRPDSEVWKGEKYSLPRSWFRHPGPCRPPQTRTACGMRLGGPPTLSDRFLSALAQAGALNNKIRQACPRNTGGKHWIIWWNMQTNALFCSGITCNSILQNECAGEMRRERDGGRMRERERERERERSSALCLCQSTLSQADVVRRMISSSLQALR